MILTTIRRPLIDALRRVASVGAQSATVRFDGTTASASVFCEGVFASAPFETGRENGSASVVVPRVAVSFLSEANDSTVEIDVDDTGCDAVFRCGTSRLRTTAPKVAEFARPAVATRTVAFASETLKRVVRALAPIAKSGDDPRYALRTICLDATEPGRLSFVATNGRVLAAETFATPNDFGAERRAVPAEKIARIVAALDDAATVEVGFVDGFVTFATPTFWASAPSVVGDYPPWRRVVEAAGGPKTARVEKAELANAVRLAKITTDKKRRIRLLFDLTGFTASAVGAEIGSSVVCGAATGVFETLAFDVDSESFAFLERFGETETVEIAFAERKPIRIAEVATKANGVSGAVAVVMPMGPEEKREGKGKRR